MASEKVTLTKHEAQEILYLVECLVSLITDRSPFTLIDWQEAILDVLRKQIGEEPREGKRSDDGHYRMWIRQRRKEREDANRV